MRLANASLPVVGLVLLTLTPTGESLAGELPGLSGAVPNRDFDAIPRGTAVFASMVAIPPSYLPSDVLQSRTFSTRDFRPRGHSLLEKEPLVGGPDEPPMIGSSTLWQRLAEYRVRDRVRLLTLWETGGSSVSLLAGKKGGPSLQWTSRLMNRGAPTRGVLDRFLASSVARAGQGLHLGSRPANTEFAAKQANSADFAAPGTR